jgi:PncC family amidohydrolase
MPPNLSARLAAGRLHRLLLGSGLRLALAESCTGGLISALLTDLPGSSGYFWGGAVVYSNRAKSILAGVPEGLIACHGAVSEETVRALLDGILETSGADLACAVSGIAGPGGGSPGKPVGTVYAGVKATGAQALVERLSLKGGRRAVRLRSAEAALRLLAALAALRLDNSADRGV